MAEAAPAEEPPTAAPEEAAAEAPSAEEPAPPAAEEAPAAPAEEPPAAEEPPPAEETPPAPAEPQAAEGEAEAGEHAFRTPTPRELQIVRLLADGQSNKEIAAVLQLSIRTVETYRARLMTKLKVHSAAEIVRYAIRQRFIEP